VNPGDAVNGTSNGATPDVTLDALRSRLGDRYAIDRQLGRGGMGAVYLARDLQLDRPVALKVLPAEYAAQSDLRERFLRETRMAASFSHPNIVPVFSVEDRQHLLAFAMGYVEGESLAERVNRSGPLSVKELVRLLQDVGYALAYAHGRGVVHRDIKPDNIMIERATGRALLMDFGISRTITSTPSLEAGLTRVGEVVGTPEFMSPEQASGDNVDGRSDLYSLGLVAWFAATGRLAISGDTTQKVLVKQLTEPVPPVLGERSDLPRALADAIDRCVRKDPAERFASAEELVETIDVARLAGPEVPLPIRLFAEEALQAGLVLFGGVFTGVLLYIALGTLWEGNLDIILPVVLFAALVWGRLAQSGAQARRLARRGFGSADVQRGLSAILAEREAERAQLRADADVVARRRRQVIVSVLLFAATYGVRWYVLSYQRVETSEGWYQVSNTGTYLLYALNVTRGFAIVALLRSPLRRPPGEWLFGLFWLGPLGRLALRSAAMSSGGSGGGRPSEPDVVAIGSPSPVAPKMQSRPPAAARSDGAPIAVGGASVEPFPSAAIGEQLQRLESRVASLERAREQRE